MAIALGGNFERPKNCLQGIKGFQETGRGGGGKGGLLLVCQFWVKKIGLFASKIKGTPGESGPPPSAHLSAHPKHDPIRVDFSDFALKKITGTL